MTILYLDATAGIAGDMTVAALLDLGVPLEHLQQELRKLGLPEEAYRLSVGQVERGGMRGCHFDVLLPHHNHSHDHHHHHRSYAGIRQMIANSALKEAVRTTAQKIFLRLAEAEALAHQVGLDDVQFHEVGAVDSTIDIVAVAIGLDWLGVEQLYVERCRLGGGFVETAHGRLPIPAPATAVLLKGLAVHGGCGDGERVTPTGAAILAALARPVTILPVSSCIKIGHGAGTKDFSDCPNILRAFLMEEGLESGTEQVLEVSCNLDDVTAELIGYTQELLTEQGALDCWCQPIQMKKGRPAVMLSFLCRSGQLDSLSALLLRETGALGLRYHERKRITLERSIEERDTPWGAVRCKLGAYGEKPEYEDCRRIAREQGVPLREVQRQVVAGGRHD